MLAHAGVESVEEDLEGDSPLESRQARPNAEVSPVAEAQNAMVRAAHVEAVRVGVHLGIPVGRGQVEYQESTSTNRDS